MPAALIGAGVGAVGAVAQGASSKKGAKKAAEIQAQSATEQRALLTDLYNKNTANYAPDMANGNLASTAQTDYLGLTKRADGASPTDQLRATPGYQFLQDEGAKAVNTNAYAAGQGNSGSVLKALQARAMNIADTTGNNYFAQLGTVAGRGMDAKGAIAGLSTNYGTSTNAVAQNNANAQSGSVMSQANSFNKMVDGVSGAVSPLFGSSYGEKKKV
jgi:hypothetical protein